MSYPYIMLLGEEVKEVKILYLTYDSDFESKASGFCLEVKDDKKYNACFSMNVFVNNEEAKKVLANPDALYRDVIKWKIDPRMVTNKLVDIG